MDGVRGKFITVQHLERWTAETASTDQSVGTFLEPLRNAIRTSSIGRFIATQVGEFVRAVSLVESATALDHLTNRYRFRLKVNDERRKQYDLYKRLALDLIFGTPQVQQLELKADVMLRRLFGCFRKNYWGSRADDAVLKLLPLETHALLMAEPKASVSSRARLVCDHIAGMSDDFAVRTYQRLFEADFGSIVDLV